MSEESGGENNVKGTIDAVTGLVKAVPIYEDMVQPVAKQLGKTLETVGKAINLALFPVSGLVWGYENIQAFLSTTLADRLKDVPPEDIITPKPNVAGPAIEALRFTGHEESLSDMYANLLAAAMDKNTAAGAHPAFVEIIKQLTPDEAKVLSLFSASSSFPLINLEKKRKQEMGTVNVLVNFSHLAKHCHLDAPPLVPIYLDNLCRLGLLSIPEGQYLTAKDAYAALESDPEILRIKTIIDSDSAFLGQITQRVVRTTEFGRQFLKVCTLRKA